MKRDIARIMTALRERELMRQYGGLEAEPEEVTITSTKEAPRRGRGLFSRFGNRG